MHPLFKDKLGRHAISHDHEAGWEPVRVFAVDPEGTNRWQWGDGRSIPAGFWAQGEPNNRNGRCAYMDKGGLRAGSCTDKKAFACMYRLRLI